MRMLIVMILVVSLCGCQPPEEPTVQHEQSQKAFEKMTITGETAANGVYDPSLEYDNDTGWMAYSAVEAPKYVHTQLAKSTDHGKTWVHVSTINKAVDSTIVMDGKKIEGVWRHEVPTLVYDPEDTGREWKLFWHKE